MTRGKRLGLLAVVVAAAVVAFVLAKPGGNGGGPPSGGRPSGIGQSPASSTSIRVKNGSPVGGVTQIIAKKGGRVRFAVTSDVADEIHVHGYDLHKDVRAGGTARFDFPATIDGAFVVELEKRSEQIAELKVEP